jgi:ATP-dependent helicase/nuclease subunit A
MQRVGASALPDGTLVHAFGAWPPDAPGSMANRPPAALPGWARARMAEPSAPAPSFSPSDLGGAKALPGEAGQDIDLALARGTLVHRLLECPADSDPATLAAIAGDSGVLSEVRAVLAAHPGLFAPGTLAEVPVTAMVAGRRMIGSVDRLVIGPDHVLAVDFKTNQIVPRSAAEVPEGILRQMGAYAAALAQIYPGRRIETAMLWTKDALLMPLDPDIVSAALARATFP